MTKIEIINETVEVFSTSPRSVKGKSCMYESSKGYHCAFSRCCTKRGIEILKKYEGRTVSNIPGAINFLKRKYRGYDIEFWTNVQFLHDNYFFWYRKKLSPIGLDYVKNLKKKYA